MKTTQQDLILLTLRIATQTTEQPWAHLHHALRHAGAAVCVPEVLQQPCRQLRAQQQRRLTQQQLPAGATSRCMARSRQPQSEALQGVLPKLEGETLSSS